MINLAFLPSWVYKRHLLKIKCLHASLNKNVLALTSVAFRPMTVEVPNLALTRNETNTSSWLNFFMYFIQHCLICRPSESTVSEDAGIEPRTVATLALTVRRSVRSHGWSAGWLYCAPTVSPNFLLFHWLYCTENFMYVYLGLRPKSSLLVWICLVGTRGICAM